MPRYALLTKESSNRVYAGDAPRLLAAELTSIDPHFSFDLHGVEIAQLGGVKYVLFEAEVLIERDLFFLSNLSGIRAIFRFRGDALEPLPQHRLRWFNEDLVTIQRYQGKTNEQFTHLLLNVTVAASASAHGRAAAGEQVRVLDPVVGRGTTLNRALIYGFDAFGVEQDSGSVDQYRQFLTTYLKTNRVKHTVASERFRKGALAGDSAFDVDIARGRQDVRMVNGDTARAREYFPGVRVDAIVGDLPYGVRHGAKLKDALRRSPLELVAESAASWKRMLANGGAIGLSFNTKTMPKAELERVLKGAGLTVVDHPQSFEHIVDRAITRDLVVATESS